MSTAMPELSVSEPIRPEPSISLQPARRTPPWGWAPAVLTLVLSAAVLWAYGVSVADIVRFGAYVLLALVVPGTLLWRALRGGPGLLVSDVAAGTVLGYAIEVLAYVGARAVGAPRLALVVPAATVVAFLAVPGLRRFWRGSGERAPAWWSWLVSISAGFMMVWSAVSFYRTHGLTEPWNGKPYVDIPFHLALAGEVKHHFPPITPYVRGEELKYHWFVYADLSATSWATGIELQTLLFRLSMLPMLMLTVVLIAVLARTITGRWWTGPVAIGVTLLAVGPSPYAWLDAPVADASMLIALWLSPTQTFGAMLCLPVVLVLVEMLRESPRPPAAEQAGAEPPAVGRWILLTVLLAALTGAKATFLPLLLGGLAVVLAGHGIARRRLHRTALGAFALTAAALAFAQVVLFDGSDGGMTVGPLAAVRKFDLSILTGLTAGEQKPFEWPLVLGFAIALFAWACIWSGVFGLFRRREALADPAHLLCLGIAGAGLGAALTFHHPQLGQLYFFISARPYLTLLAVAGLAVAIPAAAQRGRTALLLAPVLLAGAGVVWLLRMTGDETVPTRKADGGPRLAAVLGLPYLVLLGLVLLAALAVFVFRRRPLVGQIGLAVVLVLMSGYAAQATYARHGPMFGAAIEGRWRNEIVIDKRRPASIPVGAVAAGRWLRDHSRPDDLVATNGHCQFGQTRPGCDSRHFWVAAFTERRVLLEGWAYTRSAHAHALVTDTPQMLVPFWDQRLFADNEDAFRAPSQASIGRLRDRYGVRWLFVDTRYRPPPATLAQFAALRFSAGVCQVYELV